MSIGRHVDEELTLAGLPLGIIAFCFQTSPRDVPEAEAPLIEEVKDEEQHSAVRTGDFAQVSARECGQKGVNYHN